MYSLFCLFCDKSIRVARQGKADLERDFTSKKHVDLLNSKRAQRPITQHFVEVDSELNKLVSAAKVKVTGLLDEHNLLFVTEDI